MEEGLLKSTGKTLDHWIKVVKKSGIDKHKAIINFLKEEHDFSYGFANFVAHKAKQTDAASQDAGQLIQAQYAGKENLIPIFEKLQSYIKSLSSDVQEVPKKSAVSYTKKRQFALVKPATKTRIDLGLKIKNQAPKGKLEASGPFGTMCTHRIQLKKMEDLDQETLEWIATAYKNVD